MKSEAAEKRAPSHETRTNILIIVVCLFTTTCKKIGEITSLSTTIVDCYQKNYVNNNEIKRIVFYSNL